MSELNKEIKEQSEQSISVTTLLPTATDMLIMMKTIEELLK